MKSSKNQNLNFLIDSEFNLESVQLGQQQCAMRALGRLSTLTNLQTFQGVVFT